MSLTGNIACYLLFTFCIYEVILNCKHYRDVDEDKA